MPDNPKFLNDFLVHMKVVRLLSDRTIREYCFDTRLFLKYIYACNHGIEGNIDDVDISEMSADELKNISVSDIYSYIFYTSDERNNKERARYRKISSLRSFFKYITKVARLIDNDPTRDLDVPAPKGSMPKFLSLSESRQLLESAGLKGVNAVRDYCIITVFLNCGVRLSELVGINMRDIDFEEKRIRIMGKGGKERMVYLNDACLDSLEDYLHVRNGSPENMVQNALFLSNQHKRISKRRVQQIVEESLQFAGLDGKGITTHKLRHTAATLMYQYGNADLLTLKELLGHSSVSTTEIYTHINSEKVRSATEGNPLSKIKLKHD